MNLPNANASLYTNQNFCTKNVEPKYKMNPFLNIKANYPMKNLSYPHINNNIILNNNSQLKLQKNKTFSIPFDMEPKIDSKYFYVKCFNNMNNTNDYSKNKNFKIFNKSDIQSNGRILCEPIIPKNNYIPQYFKNNINNSLCKIYLEKCGRVIIFDLDDTLIPTYWIRSVLFSKCHLNQDEALRELKKEIKLNKKYNFESTACSVIHLAKSMSHTIFIVTNARSDKWIDTVKWLFPNFSKLLDEHNIPIIRTEQYMEPSPLNVFEYFRYWMNAKKKKFDEILKEHWAFYYQYITNKIDFISLGDTEFEEVATYELQSSNKNIIKKAFNIKVQTGLSFEDFIGQLKLIQVALSIITKESYSYKYLALSSSVQIKMFA
ncbi:conserved Plasmodium protein, unknown function [Plasmodium gallinaceum]|uniref:Uncharacterized protein n=1 Tax=Plasmodium gallinaceum TaxID=5849 RepID=A0A1J1GLK1_PLAGA|nr:conserved Plasmodium protein, unknown function [Plasmodium gallinaceum]CRG93220.1 conserved Plasmodium protein, unknown function [Plasmodium gallinaceum]